MSLDIPVSKVFVKTLRATTRVIVHEGSSRSTKTYSVCQYLIDRCLRGNPWFREGLRITIARKKLTWLKATAMVDFYDILKNIYCVYNPDDERDSGCTYTLNGCTFSFIGLDEAQKVHGRKQDIAWINEAMELDAKEYKQLAIRTTEQVILDYNPSMEQHWIYDQVIPRNDCTFIKSTYKDNPFLPQTLVEEIERLEPTPTNIAQGTADEVAWKIYGLGERASHKGLIFSSMEICKSLPPRDEWQKRFYGMDFGYTNDPTALVEVVYAHGNLYLKQLIYKRGLTNVGTNSIDQYMKDMGMDKSSVIWADSAEPKSIAELNNAGWLLMRGADKGPDSIKVGIDTINRYKCFITEESIDLIKEKNNYKWREDTTGRISNVPIDNWNHALDAVRYACIMEMRKLSVSILDSL